MVNSIREFLLKEIFAGNSEVTIIDNVDVIDSVLSEHLKGREKQVFMLRFRGLVYKEIGEILGVSRERAAQIMRQGVRRIKHPKVGRKIIVNEGSSK